MSSNHAQAEWVRYLVLGAQREGQRMFAAALEPLGVTPTQAEALRVLAEHEPLRLRELGELLISESGSPSRVAAALTRAGWVERHADEDRRALQLRLTREGRRLARAVAKAETAFYQQLALALDGRDVSQIVELLAAFVRGRTAGDALARRGLLPSVVSR